MYQDHQIIRGLPSSTLDRIPEYVKKWGKAGLCTEPADRNRAEGAVERIYREAGFEPPEKIVWCQSFDQVVQELNQVQELSMEEQWVQLGEYRFPLTWDRQRQKVEERLLQRFTRSFYYAMNGLCHIQGKSEHFEHSFPATAITRHIRSLLLSRYLEEICRLYTRREMEQGRIPIVPSSQVALEFLALGDFAGQELGMEEEVAPLQPYMELVDSVGYVFLFARVGFLCERFAEINRDEEGRLHGDGQPALVGRDGWKAWFWRNTMLEEKYGSVPSDQWKASWVLEERNAGVRRTLVEGIGYGRLVRELDGKRLDQWEEYELIRLEDIDFEPVMLLSMNCPSTGATYCLRVPPNMVTAREAVRWVNWGVDKREFDRET